MCVYVCVECDIEDEPLPDFVFPSAALDTGVE